MDPITSKDVWLLLIVTIVATSIIVASLYERTIARFQEREITYHNRIVELESELNQYAPTPLQLHTCDCAPGRVDPDCEYFQLLVDEQRARNKARAELETTATEIGWGQ